MMPRIIRSVLPVAWALAVAAALTSVQARAQAQAGQPQGFQNLQVLPKDIPRAELGARMRSFTTALGVQCEYCHVREGRGGRNDMASDEKQPKKTARVMMQMVDHVNEMIATGVGKPAADVVKVDCITCHRGQAIPKVEAPAPADAR